jgi:ANTAR domain
MTDEGGPQARGARHRLHGRVGDLCLLGAREAGADGAGVSMLTVDGTPDPVFATDDRSALVEDLQFTLGIGPCFDASRSRSPVLVPDLLDGGGGVEARWPAFVDEAVRAGIRAVFAFPLGTGSIHLGTLDLYRATPGGLSTVQLARTLLLADVVGMVLLDGGASPLEDPDPLRHRAVVHQAAGMVMVQLDVSIEEALVVLRSTAYAEGLPINELAAAVVGGRRRLTKEHP